MERLAIDFSFLSSAALSSIFEQEDGICAVLLAVLSESDSFPDQI